MKVDDYLGVEALQVNTRLLTLAELVLEHCPVE